MDLHFNPLQTIIDRMKNLIRFLFFILPLGAFANTVEPKSGSVVLVHGFLRSRMNMSAIEYTLHQDDWEVLNWGYPSRKKSIQDHSAALVLELKKISQKNPGKPISFVTHSMGGLVVRGALNNPDCPPEAKIGRAVLIAPPNRGSCYARFLSNYALIRWYVGEKSGKELLSTPVDGFDHIGNFPAGMPILVIGGTVGWNPSIEGINDGKVAFNETCLPTKHYHKGCRAGHSWICQNRDAVKKAKRFLTTKILSSEICNLEQEKKLTQ